MTCSYTTSAPPHELTLFNDPENEAEEPFPENDDADDEEDDDE